MFDVCDHFGGMVIENISFDDLRADSEFFEKVTCNLNESGETCVDGALNAYLLSMQKNGDPFIHGNFRSTCHVFNLVFYRLEYFNRYDGKNPIPVFIYGR